MSETDEIIRIVNELNRTKGNVVKSMKNFVAHGNKLIEQTPKESKQSTEKVAEISRRVHQVVESSNIIDLKISATSHVAQSIMILRPSKGTTETIDEDEAIELLFDTTHLSKPFAYEIYAKLEHPTTGSSVLLMRQKTVNSTTPESTSESQTIPHALSPGTYRLIIKYQNAKMSSPAEEDVKIIIGPKRGGPGPVHNVTIESLMEEIRKNINSGITASEKSIKSKIDEIQLSVSLRPYLKDLLPILKNSNSYDEMKSRAENVVNDKKEKHPSEVMASFVAIINRINEYQYYETTVNIFKKMTAGAETDADYARILQEYTHQKRHIETQLESINKTQTDNSKKRTPQDDARRIVTNAELAKRLLSKKMSHSP